VRHQDRYRHVLEHEVRRTPENEFANAGVSVGAHHEKIRPNIESPHFEGLAGGQASGRKPFGSRPDIMAGQSRGQFGTGYRAWTVQGLLRIDPGDGDGFGLLKDRDRIEGRPGGLP